MSSSTLHVAGLLVVSSDDVPLHSEYALFDAGDIELRSSGPGTVREMGYTTTADKARERLEAQGIDARLVARVEEALRPNAAASYARGDAVRSLVPHMSAGELLDGGSWMAEEQSYQGTFLHLSELARDIGITQAPLALQAVALASLLNDVADDAPVVLSTLNYTRERRPGERTHRRVSLEHATEVPEALRRLAARPSSRAGEIGPTKLELLETMRIRAEVVSSLAGKERMIRFERALAERQMPARGPLADSAAWKLELLLARGQTEGVSDTLDMLEKMRGRSPTTAYLRARAALLTGDQDPKTIAEKVAALGMSMNAAFPELELLIAEAWAAAGDSKRALPYARDLISNPALHADLRARAEAILQRGDTRPRSIPAMAAPSTGSSPPAPSGSTKAASAPPRYDSDDGIPAALRGSAIAAQKARPPSEPPPISVSRTGTLPPPVAQSSPPSMPPTTRGSTASVRPPEEMPSLDDLPRQPSMIPTGRNSGQTRSPTQPGMPAPDGSALDLVDSRVPSVRPGARMSAEYQAVNRSAPSSNRPSQLPPPSNRERERRASNVPDPRAEPGSETPSFTAAQEILAEDVIDFDSGTPRAPSVKPQSLRPTPPRGEAGIATRPPPPPPTRRPSESAVRLDYMKGASQPSFKAQTTVAGTIPAPTTNAPMFPRSDPQALELAATLDLPYGLGDQRWSGSGSPRSVLEARLHFTHLSRQLGVMYKQQLGVELTADVAGIESMQRHLLDKFSNHTLLSAEDAEDARRHGAFLSEVLTRRLNAEWIDISSTDLGYWGMLVGPETRVWPFGRVLRYISLGYKERDLVSYFLELQTRLKT